MSETDLKTCIECQVAKPLAAFHRRRSPRARQVGVRPVCRECVPKRYGSRSPQARQDEKRKAAELSGRRYLSRAQRADITAQQAQPKPRANVRVVRGQWHVDLHMPGLTPKQARKKLANAIALGYITKPDRCQRCDAQPPSHRLHGHHHDYDYPLRVEWICAECHTLDHGHTC